MIFGRNVQVLDGDLYSPVDGEESTWVIEDGFLILTLLKKLHREWPSIVKNNKVLGTA